MGHLLHVGHSAGHFVLLCSHTSPAKSCYLHFTVEQRGPERSYCGRRHREGVAGPASEPRAYDTKTRAHDQLSPRPRLPERVPRAAVNTLLAPAPLISPGLPYIIPSNTQPGTRCRGALGISVEDSQPSQ